MKKRESSVHTSIEGEAERDISANADTAIENLSTEHPWLRLHPLSPLLRGGIVLLVIVGIVFANFRDRLIGLVVADEYIGDSAPNEADLVSYLVEAELLIFGILICLGVIILFMVVAWVSWRFHTYRVTDDAVEQRTGVLFRQHRRAPLDRIQIVNLQRPLIARLVGLTQVEVQTAGQDGKITLNYLGFAKAKEVREDILHRSSTSRQRTQHDSASSKESRAGFGVSATRVLERRANEILDDDVEQTAHDSGAIVSVPVGRLIGSIALGWEVWIPLALLAAIVWAAIVVSPFFLTMLIPLGFMTIAIVFSAFNKGFRFTLSSTGDGVRLGAGLTSTTTESIPFGRIHAIEARQPIGWRMCGWWKMRITTAGHSLAQGGQNKMQNIVLPVGNYADCERVFATLLPSSADTAEQLSELREALLGWGHHGGFTPAGSRAPWVLWFGARRAGIRVALANELQHSTLRIRRGWLTRTFIAMPLVRAQSLQLHRPLVQRALGLATITAHTVLGPVMVYMRGLKLDTAREFFTESTKVMLAVQQSNANSRAVMQRARSHKHYRSGRTAETITAIRVAAPRFSL